MLNNKRKTISFVLALTSMILICLTLFVSCAKQGKTKFVITGSQINQSEQPKEEIEQSELTPSTSYELSKIKNYMANTFKDGLDKDKYLSYTASYDKYIDNTTKFHYNIDGSIHYNNGNYERKEKFIYPDFGEDYEVELNGISSTSQLSGVTSFYEYLGDAYLINTEQYVSGSKILRKYIDDNGVRNSYRINQRERNASFALDKLCNTTLNYLERNSEDQEALDAIWGENHNKIFSEKHFIDNNHFIIKIQNVLNINNYPFIINGEFKVEYQQVKAIKIHGGFDLTRVPPAVQKNNLYNFEYNIEFNNNNSQFPILKLTNDQEQAVKNDNWYLDITNQNVNIYFENEYSQIIAVNTIFNAVANSIYGYSVNNYFPSDINKEFLGWYYDEQFSMPVTVNQDNQLEIETGNSDLTIYAKVDIKADLACKVSFVTGSAYTIPDKVMIKNKSKTMFMPTPKKTGYKFEGWYYDQEFNNKLVSQTITQDIVLYAKWSPLTEIQLVGVGLDRPLGKMFFNTQGEYHSSMLSIYNARAEREGYKFEGWYYDINFTQPLLVNDGMFKFNFDIVEGNKLYAKYRKTL